MSRMLVCLLVLVCGWSVGLAAAADVEIPDPQLDQILREILKKKQIDKLDRSKPITEEDLQTVFFLDAPRRGIEKLTGLEKCRNLAQVVLTGNKITDVSPLSGCPNLQSLTLKENKIQDLSPLAGLSKLQYLQLDQNEIRKLDPLASCTALGSLSVSGNQIESLTPLAELPKLHSLSAAKNRLTDVTPLKSLRWLETLDLRDNQIKEVKSLANLGELRWTFLDRNQLTDLTPLVEMVKRDLAGERRFAPFWNLSVQENPLSAAGQSQLKELQQLGVRVLTKK